MSKEILEKFISLVRENPGFDGFLVENLDSGKTMSGLGRLLSARPVLVPQDLSSALAEIPLADLGQTFFKDGSEPFDQSKICPGLYVTSDGTRVRAEWSPRCVKNGYDVGAEMIMRVLPSRV